MYIHMLSLLLMMPNWGELPGSRLHNGYVEITLPSDVLADEEVAEQLTSGLTTTFRVMAGPRRNPHGGARIDIRYELWDEVFLVHVWNVDGDRASHSFANKQALISWWKQHQLRVMATRIAQHNLKITLDVIPFSTTEQSSAQRWVTQTPTRTAPAQTANTNSGSPQVPSYLDRLLATSIQRKPLIQFSWRLAAR